MGVASQMQATSVSFSLFFCVCLVFVYLQLLELQAVNGMQFPLGMCHLYLFCHSLDNTRPVQICSSPKKTNKKTLGIRIVNQPNCIF